MQYKDNKNIGFKAGKADKNFTEERFTHLHYNFYEMNEHDQINYNRIAEVINNPNASRAGRYSHYWLGMCKNICKR